MSTATTTAPEKTNPTPTAPTEPDYLAQAIAEEMGADAPDLLSDAKAEDGGEGSEELEAEGEKSESTTETDTEEQSEEEGQESAEDPEKEEESEAQDPQSKLPVSVQKRIDGLTAEKKRLAEKLEAQDAELAKAKTALEKFTAAPVIATPSEQDPLANIHTVEQLNERISSARAIKRWALENLEGGRVTNNKGEEMEVSPEDVRRHLANADEVITEQAPRRAQYLREVAAHEATARETYPALFDPESEDFFTAVQIIQQMPEVMRYPDWKLTVGDVITARRARLEKSKDPKAGAAAPAPGNRAVAPVGAKSARTVSKTAAPLAPRVTEPTATRSVAPAKGANAARLKQRAAESGDDADMEAYFMAAH